MESICKIVRDAETNYLTGTTKMSKYVSWNMHETLQTIDAYLNSKHISGATDSQGREKPFFNIVTSAVNIWYRATDIDRKDIKFIPTKSSSVALAFVANVMLQNWMMKYRFGKFLNSWGREMARYGSAVTKFVEKDGELIPTVIPWSRFIADPVQFDALPRIEKLYLTPAQLRKNKMYDQKVVDTLVENLQSRQTLDGNDQDLLDKFVEVYEVHGELDSRHLDEEPDESLEDSKIKYVQQMHVVAFIKGKGGEYEDLCLFKGRESKDPYLKTDLIEEDGRTLGIGAVEYLFDAQWMQNHTVKNMKDTLDITSKLIFQTADTNYIGRNVLNAIETGDIFVHKQDMPLTRVANDKPDVSALMNFRQMWFNLGQDITSTPDGARGITPPSGTALGTVQIVTSQGLSLFEIMAENKGLSMEDMMRDHVIPNLKRKLKNKDEIVAVLDNAGITEFDSMYIPAEAVKRYNDKAFKQLAASIDDPNAPLPTPFDANAEQNMVKQEMGSLGNKRFLKPDDLDQKSWDEVFSDFEWDSLIVEVTNEQTDKRAVLDTLSVLFKDLTAIAQQGGTMTDEQRLVFGQILTETGRISPLQIHSGSKPAQMPMAPQPQPQMPVGAVGGGLPVTQ